MQDFFVMFLRFLVQFVFMSISVYLLVWLYHMHRQKMVFLVPGASVRGNSDLSDMVHGPKALCSSEEQMLLISEVSLHPHKFKNFI